MLSKYKWIIASASVACGLVMYYLSDDGNSTPSAKQPVLTKEKVLSIARELRKELTPVFITFASFSLSIKEKLGGRVPDEYIKEILMANSPIQVQIQKAETKVYDKHKITQLEFQNACETQFGSDKEISEILESIKVMMEGAFKGIHPVSNIPLPEFLTAEYTLKVTEELYDVTKYVTYKKLEEMQARGMSFNVNSPGFKIVADELESETFIAKNKVFDKFGMTGLDEPSTMLMHSAVQTYKPDPAFIRKLADIEQNFQLAMNFITSNTLPEKEVKRLEAKFGKVSLIEELDEPREVVEKELIEEISTNTENN